MKTNTHRVGPDKAKTNGIELVFEMFGDPSAIPMVLVSGFSRQMIEIDENFCLQLADRGFRVIRFDNRDVGRSTHCNHLGTPNISDVIKSRGKGEEINLPYRLHDMADDTAGLLDALNIESAHVVGISMGGMISQLLAVNHSARVKTLTSIMSTTSEPNLPPPTPEATSVLFAPPPKNKIEFIEYSIHVNKILTGPVFHIDEDRARELANQVYNRGLNPAGIARQYAAIIGSGGRKELLRSVSIATQIIHGDKDPLVPVECGMDTADAISGAKQLIIKGMGHYLAPALWTRIIDAIASHART